MAWTSFQAIFYGQNGRYPADDSGAKYINTNA